MLRQILIAGDSTVTNRGPSADYESGICYTGWGEMLSLYLGIYYRIKNFAKSGLTTDTFRSEGHYDLLLSKLKEGDYVLFQFGHNDQKLKELHFNGRYKENFVTYINEIRERKANPILVTPLARNTWNNIRNEYNDLLFDYANAVKEVALATNTPCVDLHGFAKNWIIENGSDGVRPYFYPGDRTHTNDYGAYFFAGFVANSLEKYIEISKESFDWNRLCPSVIPKFLSEESECNLTRREALVTARVMGGFFTKSEEIPTDKDKEIICAEQNGYKLFEDRLEDFIIENDFLKLMDLAISRQNPKIKELFTEKSVGCETIKRIEVLVLLKAYEENMNFATDKSKHEIAGC